MEYRVVYCENDECRVLIFETQSVMESDDEATENCPGCGQFGRTKGK